MESNGATQVENAAISEPDTQGYQQTATSSAQAGQYCRAINQEDSAVEQASAEESEVVGPNAEYFAQLAGFGTARAAQQFAQRLLRKEIQVVVKKRQSRSARGKFVSWYQVVTEKFDDRDQLEALVQRLEKEEKLKGVHIVSC
jgi:septal ring-binding cell division protein DamX